MTEAPAKFLAALREAAEAGDHEAQLALRWFKDAQPVEDERPAMGQIWDTQPEKQPQMPTADNT